MRLENRMRETYAGVTSCICLTQALEPMRPTANVGEKGVSDKAGSAVV